MADGAWTGLCMHAAWAEKFLLDWGLLSGLRLPALRHPRHPETGVWNQALAQLITAPNLCICIPCLPFH